MDISRTTKARLYVNLYTKVSEICKLLPNNNSLSSRRLHDLNSFLNSHLMVVINPLPYNGNEITLRFWMNMEYSLRKGLLELNYIKFFRIKCPKTLTKENVQIFYDCLNYIRNNIRTLIDYYPYKEFIGLFSSTIPLKTMERLHKPCSDIFIEDYSAEYDKNYINDYKYVDEEDLSTV